MPDECGICFDNFNGSTKKKCVCQYCQAEYCRECVGTWLTTIIDEPRCPSDTCKKAWSREYLDTVMTKVWRDSVYREYREKLLMDRERALLPSTQPRIEAINEANRIENDVIVRMRDRRRELMQQIRLLQQEDQGIQTQIWDLNHQCLRMRNGEGVDENTSKRAFVRRCPSDGCRGFLSTAWKCGVCELYSCNECHEVKGVARDSAHTCDPNSVETAKLIAKDTKACPKCGEMITKIDGCDQMWCVSCHTAFSWRTGQAATGIVHNPHFYEWQRRQNNGEAPRVDGDIPCGGLVDWTVVRSAIISNRPSVYPAWVCAFEVAHRRITHVINVDMVQINPDANNQNNNIDLRISYLLKEINDDAMMATLIAREKKIERDRELRRIYETLTAAAIDIFRRVVATSNEKAKIADELKKTATNSTKEAESAVNEAKTELLLLNPDLVIEKYNPYKELYGENIEGPLISVAKQKLDAAKAAHESAAKAEINIKAEANYRPLLNELNELRKFINEALDNLRRRYNSTIHGFDTNWERLSLKKRREGEVETSEVEIKTVYGTFVEGINNYLALPSEPPSETESGRTKFDKHFKLLRKIERLIPNFPETGSRETQNLAIRLVEYYKNCVNVLCFGSGLNSDIWQRDYYARLRDRHADCIDRWQKHVSNLELTLKKEMNTIM
jgi:hypothetical protein